MPSLQQHEFHKKCIATWFVKRKTCPMCRKKFQNFKTAQNLQAVDIEDPGPNLSYKRRFLIAMLSMFDAIWPL